MANPLLDFISKQGTLATGNYIRGQTKGKVLIRCGFLREGGFKGTSAIVKLRILESSSKAPGVAAHTPGENVSFVKNLTEGDQKKKQMSGKALNQLMVAAVGGDPDTKTMPDEAQLKEILNAAFEVNPAADTYQLLRGFVVRYDTVENKGKWFPNFEIAAGENTAEAVAKRRAEMDKADPVTFD